MSKLGASRISLSKKKIKTTLRFSKLPKMWMYYWKNQRLRTYQMYLWIKLLFLVWKTMDKWPRLWKRLYTSIRLIFCSSNRVKKYTVPICIPIPIWVPTIFCIWNMLRKLINFWIFYRIKPSYNFQSRKKLKLMLILPKSVLDVRNFLDFPADLANNDNSRIYRSCSKHLVGQKDHIESWHFELSFPWI